jgi:hypothetical protein
MIGLIIPLSDFFSDCRGRDPFSGLTDWLEIRAHLIFLLNGTLSLFAYYFPLTG